MLPIVRIISMREEYAQIGMQVLCCQAPTELAGRIANRSSISTADRREAIG